MGRSKQTFSATVSVEMDLTVYYHLEDDVPKVTGFVNPTIKDIDELIRSNVGCRNDVMGEAVYGATKRRLDELVYDGDDLSEPDYTAIAEWIAEDLGLYVDDENGDRAKIPEWVFVDVGMAVDQYRDDLNGLNEEPG